MKDTGGKKTETTDSPLVSVITITYNSAKYLDETIKSVIGQDYSHVEYIIIDGGSTDDTLNIIRRYEGKIRKWISEPDKGISDAMNKGIRMASGNIVGIIHSDDYYADPTVLRRVAEVFDHSPQIKALYGIQDFIDSVTGEALITWGRDAEPAEIKKRMYIPHPTLFVRREVYDEIGLFGLEYKVAMDYEFALRLTKHTRPYFLNYKIACMRDMGTSGKQFMKAFGESIRALVTHRHYSAAFLAVMRNTAKQVLIWLGLKKLLYRLWEKNVSPK
ncbi:MAG: glycosyltransferase [Nitrospirae bacterium]|nr:glycosyltransferase [Nitrospirota bacterium]